MDPLETTSRRLASLVLWLANLVAGVAIGTSYLEHLPDHASARTQVFVCLGLISTVATLALVPALVFLLLLRFARTARVQCVGSAFVGAAFLVLLYADTRVYNLLRYHFNGAVWNVMLTRGSEDAVHLGGRVWWPVAIVVVVLTTVEALLWRGVYRWRRERSARPRLRLRPALWIAGVLVAIASVEKSIYAAADLEGDREVHNASQVLPLYPRLRVSQLLPEGLSSGDETLPPVDFRELGESLDYPLEWPTLDPDGPRPNIVVLVLDSWRRDCFDALHTPRLWEYSRGARRFDDHLSGGNGTRFGLFSMLYGLHGSYWFPVLEERRPPVLLERLQDADYEIAVFSSASMSFPEFRETAWVDVLDNVHDRHESQLSSEKDVAVAADFHAWLERREESGTEAPFFAFVLLDSPHQPYYSPGGPFQPAAEELDYIELSQSRQPALVERVFNRYLNALHHADGVAGGMLDDLAARGLLDDTVLVVTGDHGEEFQENGFWGHTSNFSPEQVLVPLYVRGPGFEPGVETRPTSHLDLPSTLLELLGADPGVRAGWCLGESLLDPPAERRRVLAGWAHLGVWTPSGIFRIRNGSRSTLDVTVFDDGWNLHADQAGPYLREVGTLEMLAGECRRFLSQ